MRVRVTDKISVDDAALWMPGSNILITSPMGSGKSYFCKNTLKRLSFSESSTFKILNPLLHSQFAIPNDLTIHICTFSLSDVIILPSLSLVFRHTARKGTMCLPFPGTSIITGKGVFIWVFVR